MLTKYDKAPQLFMANSDFKFAIRNAIIFGYGTRRIYAEPPPI